MEVVGRTGLDFVSIDVEHGGKVWETVENMVRAAELSGMHALVLTQDIPAAVAKAPPAQSGVVVYGADDSARWSPRGCRFFAYPSGVGLLFDAAPGLRQDMAAACAVPREIP